MFKNAPPSEVNRVMTQSVCAFAQYKKLNIKRRAEFLHAIAGELAARACDLLPLAHQETKLEETRLAGELKRTVFQLTSYADACAEGTWLDIRIDTSDLNRAPLKPDLRKLLVPLGPVVVFGAANFPFAYSTAGGDTACALAAGCSVVVKAHPAHAQTSAAVAETIQAVAKKQGLPDGIFLHLHGAGFEVGKALVLHPLTKAVGFTGSFEGGKALADLANGREEPIPVFAEMGSVNPVFILPQKLAAETQSIAIMLAKSITQSAGQFCTNPGILVGLKSRELNQFKKMLSNQILHTEPAAMLHGGIAKNFYQSRERVIDAGAVVVASNEGKSKESDSSPTLAEVSADIFLNNRLLQNEVFGPFSLLVECSSAKEMLAVARAIKGQLTCTLLAGEKEAKNHEELIELLTEKCGRLVFNGVPTGVEVALAMHHGGPYPATTDSRYTAVGADGIRRFTRPVCFQNWNNDLLPVELRNENPLAVWRTVNNLLTKDAVETH
jgi:NADP-dependent aldehyde dehydrogenase